MKQRSLTLIRLFVSTVAVCVLQRPLFMLYYQSAHPEVGVGDYADVMLHSLPLDLTTAAYITALPWLLLLISFFFKSTTWLRRILTPYYIIVALLLALIFVADTVLYGFWGFKIDSTVFAYTDKPADAAASVSAWLIAGAVLAVVAFAAVYAVVFLRSLRSLKTLKSLRSLKSLMPLAIFVHLLMGGLLFLAIRGGVGEGTANVSRAYYSENQFLNHSAVNPAFNIIYSLAHQQNFAKEFRFMSGDEAKIVADEIWPIANSENSKLKTQNPKLKTENSKTNVLLIVWEGLGARCVESLGGDKGITPRLESIISDGVLFTQCYATSFRTDRGLVSIMSGWPGMPSASLMKIPNKCNNLPGIARSLAANGYATDFWYGGDITFTNMGGFMLANGFQRTYSDTDFSARDRSYSKWGVVDGILLDRLADDILHRPTDKLWFTTVLTLSSHEPWEVPCNRLADKKKNAFAYTDECIGTFIAKLRQSPVWDNLLVVITADHGAVVDEADTKSSTMVSRIPLVLAGGKASAMASTTNDIIMSQSDISATLLGLLGIDNSEFAFSRDVLSPDYRYPCAIHTTPIDATFIDSTGITTYDFIGKIATFTTDAATDTVRIHRIKSALQTVYDHAAGL